MKHAKKSSTSIAFCIAILLTVTTVLAATVEIRLKDGGMWRGQTGDFVEISFKQRGNEVLLTGELVKVENLYIVVEGEIGGLHRRETIFKSDIVTMMTKDSGNDTVTHKTTSKTTTNSTAKKPTDVKSRSTSEENELGVIVLPLYGTVGEEVRHQEIVAIGKEADKFGRGQIIVLLMESPGGFMVEMDPIHQAIKELRKRHRVVAWIKEAISAAAATSINCDEIYFMPEGTLGAMTMFAGDKSAKGVLLETWMETAGEYMEVGGRSKYIAFAMIDDEALLSYDKDPVTGEVTWYDNLSGEFDLSDVNTNLVFTATTAEHCGFSDGTANTKEDLAKMLNLPRWHELTDYGRKISADWVENVKRAKEQIPLAFARYNYKGTGTGSAAVVIGSRIAIIEELIRWWDRCPNVARFSLPPKEFLEREIEELRRQISQSRSRRR